MRMLLLAFVAATAVGCGQSYQPVRRETPSEPSAGGSDSSLSGAHPSMGGHPAGAAGAPLDQVGSAGQGGQVDLAAIRLTAPDSWPRRQPRSGFILAEFSLPKAEGDPEDGRLTVSVVGGGVQANLDRWRGQFGGATASTDEEEMEVAGAQVRVIQLTGTYLNESKDYSLFGAAIPAGGMDHYVKATGPKKTIAEHEESLRAFLKSLQVK